MRCEQSNICSLLIFTFWEHSLYKKYSSHKKFEKKALFLTSVINNNLYEKDSCHKWGKS